MFACPICGSSSYSVVLSEMFKCDGCSAIFSDPLKFGNIANNKGDYTKLTSEQLDSHSTSLGGIVSKPIKLNRG